MCYSHFNTEDGRKYATFLACFALFNFMKGKNATETHTVYGVYGEDAMTDQMCQKWFGKSHAGDFLLDDAPVG